MPAPAGNKAGLSAATELKPVETMRVYLPCEGVTSVNSSQAAATHLEEFAHGLVVQPVTAVEDDTLDGESLGQILQQSGQR